MSMAVNVNDITKEDDTKVLMVGTIAPRVATVRTINSYALHTVSYIRSGSSNVHAAAAAVFSGML